jgi:hypothetical protein
VVTGVRSFGYVLDLLGGSISIPDLGGSISSPDERGGKKA